jgi:hypothetical protein
MSATGLGPCPGIREHGSQGNPLTTARQLSPIPRRCRRETAAHLGGLEGLGPVDFEKNVFVEDCFPVYKTPEA